MTVTEVYLEALLKCLLDDYTELYAHTLKREFPGEEYDPADRTICRLARQAVAGLEARQQANSPARVQS